MKEILQIWIGEYRKIFSDSGVMLIFFGAIVIYPIVYPIPYFYEVLKDVPVAVVDSDYSQLSRQLTRMVDANECIKVTSKPTSLTEAKRQFFNGKISGIMVIPADFDRMIFRGEQVNIAAYCDASYFLVYRQVLTGIFQSSGTMSAGIEIKRLRAGGFSETQAFATRDPLPLISVPLFNPSGGYASYVVPAVMVLILQQTLLIGIGMLGGTTREQKNTHYLVEEAESRAGVKIVLGKSAAYFSLYLIHAIYFFGVLFRIYRFPQRGDPLNLLIFLIPFLISVIFLGIALSSLFHNREISMLALLFTSIPVLFLSGFSWPVEAIPDWLRAISFLLPSTLGIDGFLKINTMGASLRDVAVNWFALWGVAVVYFILACLSIRHLLRISQIKKATLRS